MSAAAGDEGTGESSRALPGKAWVKFCERYRGIGLNIEFWSLGSEVQCGPSGLRGPGSTSKFRECQWRLNNATVGEETSSYSPP